MRGRVLVLLPAALLTVIGAGGQPREASKRPRVYLNHVYRVLDRATFEAIERSDYLKTEFAQFERRTTVSGSDTWTGIYFYGENTYFEFLLEDPDRGRPLDSCGIALGVEDPGASAAVLAALQGLGFGPAVSIARPRETGGRMVPWFLMTGFEPKDPMLTTFVMEYEPDFLKQWNPRIRAELAGIRRSAVLARYREKAALAVAAKDPLLADVMAVTLALSPARAERFGSELSALGFERSGDAGRVWTGPGVRFTVEPETPGSRGLVALEMSLRRRPAEGRQVELGPRGRLEVRTDGTAKLTL